MAALISLAAALDRGATEATPMPPLHPQRINWMPSPPLVSDAGPIDIDHLSRMTLGDTGLERQVLLMFSAQAVGLVGAIAGLAADAGALAHKLKGSARAVGAFRLAEAASRLETVLHHGGDPAGPLADLTDAVARAHSAIEAMLRRS